MSFESTQHSLDTLSKETLPSEADDSEALFSSMVEKAKTSINDRSQNRPSEIDNTSNPIQAEHARQALDKGSLREFSKKYAPEARAETAYLIRKMRIKASLENKVVREENQTKQQKAEQLRKEVESLGLREESVSQMISEQEAKIASDKKKIGNRIMAFFGKEDDSDEQMLQKMNLGLESLKAQTSERFQMLTDLSALKEETDVMEERKKMLATFHQEQDSDHQKLESEQDERSVAKITEKYQALFIHGLAGDISRSNNTSGNNGVINSETIGTDTRLDLMIGFQPTISASTLTAEDAGNLAMYPFGVILKAGRVLDAHSQDASTQANGMYSRRKRNLSPLASSIQPVVGEKLENAIAHTNTDGRKYEEYNELVVENPDIAGLYVNLDYESQSKGDFRGINLSGVRKLAVERNIPVFGRSKGKMYKLSDEDAWIEVSLGEILKSGQPITDTERLKVAERAVMSSPFPIKKEIISKFENYTLGSSYYEYTNRIAKGEQVMLSGTDVKPYEGFGDRKWEDYKAEYGSWFHEFHTFDNDSLPITAYCQKTPNSNYYSHVSKANKPEDTPEGYVAFIGEGLQQLKARILLSQEHGDDVRTRASVAMLEQQALLQLQGFANAAKNAGDEPIYAIAMTQLQKYDPNSNSERFAEERVGEGGTLKTLDRDIPIDIQKRLSALSETESVNE